MNVDYMEMDFSGLQAVIRSGIPNEILVEMQLVMLPCLDCFGLILCSSLLYNLLAEKKICCRILKNTTVSNELLYIYFNLYGLEKCYNYSCKNLNYSTIYIIINKKKR